jgi:uncharacterized protein YraI
MMKKAFEWQSVSKTPNSKKFHVAGKRLNFFECKSLNLTLRQNSDSQVLLSVWRSPMKKLLVLLLFLAQTALAYSATTTTNLNLRLEPSQRSQVLRVLPKSTRVTVAACGQSGWCRVRAANRVGYVRGSYLRRIEARATLPKPPTSSGRGYTNSAGIWTPSPVAADAPPPGASAQCRDGTYSFSASRRGTCSRHGGVSQWLP